MSDTDAWVKIFAEEGNKHALQHLGLVQCWDQRTTASRDSTALSRVGLRAKRVRERRDCGGKQGMAWELQRRNIPVYSCCVCTATTVLWYRLSCSNLEMDDCA